MNMNLVYGGQPQLFLYYIDVKYNPIFLWIMLVKEEFNMYSDKNTLLCQAK